MLLLLISFLTNFRNELFHTPHGAISQKTNHSVSQLFQIVFVNDFALSSYQSSSPSLLSIGLSEIKNQLLLFLIYKNLFNIYIIKLKYNKYTIIDSDTIIIGFFIILKYKTFIDLKK